MQPSNKEAELQYCPTCRQMTNHGIGTNGGCLKCRASNKEAVNEVTEDTSDGYHTFTELYEHRTALFIALCHSMRAFARKSRVHEDGTMFDGMFIATLQTPNGQISYHLENKHWEELDVQEATEPWDGHTSDDVIERLKK